MKEKFDIQELVRANIRNLKPYRSARDEFKGDQMEMIFLDANENPFDHGLNRYPDPQQRLLKEEVATLKGCPAENIFLGNGSDEVLDLLFRAFCNPGEDEVITLPPTYGMYDVLAGINAVANRKILLKGDFQPDSDAILKTQSNRSKLLFLCSPNNPTGNTISDDTIALLLKKFTGLVVIDEAYIDFAENPGWRNRISDFPNLVVIQTMSKAYGMAGIRLGMCFASIEIIQILNAIKPPYNINQLTQSQALDRLKRSWETKMEVIALNTERTLLKKALQSVSFVRSIHSSEANFLLIEVDNADLRYDQLIERGIVVRNRSKEPLCANCLRVTVGTPSENSKLIEAFETI